MKRVNKSLIFISILIVFVLSLVGCTTNISENTVNIENLNEVYELATDKAIQSSVIVYSGNSRGSGVVVSSDGYVLTNDHVVTTKSNVYIEILDVNKNVKRLECEYVNEMYDGSNYEKMDLCLIKIKSNVDIRNVVLTPVTLGSRDSVTYGTPGIMIGNPKGLGFVVSQGMVSNPSIKMRHPEDCVSEFIMLDSPVNPGNSGGGFFNLKGELIGIVTLRQYDDSSDNENVVFGIGYAINIDDVKGYLARYGIK